MEIPFSSAVQTPGQARKRPKKKAVRGGPHVYNGWPHIATIGTPGYCICLDVCCQSWETGCICKSCPCRGGKGISHTEARANEYRAKNN